MRALQNDVSTSMPMRLARLRRLPSEPTDGSASAMDWSASSNLLSPSAITSRRIPVSTSASDSGVCAQPEDVERINSEVANYRKFKELCEQLVALSIEESKRKTEQRRKALAAVRSQS